MTDASDQRPPVAIGHVALDVTEVAAAAGYFIKLGLRPIHQAETFAVLELRGGTHLILRPAAGAIPPASEAPFDLMVDDLEATREAYAAMGLEPSAIESGSIHDSFVVVGPNGYRITVVSSHASGRPV